MKHMKRFLPLFLPSLLVFLLVFCGYALLFRYDNKYTAGPPYGTQGVFSLSQEEIQNGRIFFLIDGWELYPDALYSPEDFVTGRPMESQETFIGQYSNFSFFSAGHSAFGQATYRLRLRLDGPPAILSLEIPEIFTSYTLWVNGKQAAEQGSGRMVTFLLEREAELLLAVENTSHYYSGLVYPPAIGAPDAVEAMLWRQSVFYSFLTVCALTLAVFCAVVWLGKRRDRRFLYFGLFCLCFFFTCLHPFVRRLGGSGPVWYAVEDTARLGMLAQAVFLCMEAAGLSAARWYLRIVRPVCWGVCLICPLCICLILPAFPEIINPYSRMLEFFELACWLLLCLCAAAGLQKKAVGSAFILAAGAVLGAGFLANLVDNNRFEPIYTGWQTEYAGFLLVLVFGGMMIHYNRCILQKNEQMLLHMEDLVQQRTSELHKVLEERKAFFSEMAHNLKAPITATHAFIRLIREQNLYLDEELGGYLRQIESENAEMRQRVQALNTLNDFDRIHTPVTLIPVADLLKQVYRNNAPEAEACGIYFTVTPPTQPVAVRGQREKLLILFENLIYNALSFTPPEGKISVAANGDGAMAVIVVSDSGCGISAEHLPHVFERFYVGRENPGEGSGLGLYIAKITAEEMGGTISVASILGEGSTFTLRLPCAPTDNP